MNKRITFRKPNGHKLNVPMDRCGAYRNDLDGAVSVFMLTKCNPGDEWNVHPDDAERVWRAFTEAEGGAA